MDFKNSKISFGRPISSYEKVRTFYSHMIRNKRFQLKQLDESPKKILNIGCGPNIRPEFVNLDYMWRPNIDLCWDLTNGIPINSGLMKGVYTEHCVEHLSLAVCSKVISEVYRILEPRGVFRIIVPDAEQYIDLYWKSRTEGGISFPYQSLEDVENSVTPMMFVNRVFRDHGHLYAYDFETLKSMLTDAGFVDIERTSYNKGKLNELLIDTDWRKIESLYIEASKPN